MSDKNVTVRSLVYRTLNTSYKISFAVLSIGTVAVAAACALGVVSALCVGGFKFFYKLFGG